MMHSYLDVRNFPCASAGEERELSRELDAVLAADCKGSMFALLGGYQRILADNRRRGEWNGVFEKVRTLFQCGKAVPLDGPMIGVSFGIRDSDYFRETAKAFGKDRSAIANIEWMAACWNATFGHTGLWMGKTFEPVSRETFAAKCASNGWMLEHYDPATARIGRNFFREPADPNFLQGLGLPVLTRAWNLRDRPESETAPGFEGELLAQNLKKEKNVPYSKTGGLFLALPGASVVPEMNGKRVYHLNYRWPALEPAYPMTRLIDEIVQIADGIYLGELVMAACHYNLGKLRIPLPFGRAVEWELGSAYHPAQPSGPPAGGPDYGYQNNGFFLMIDPDFAKEAYADEAFPFLRPRPGEIGYEELGYDQMPAGPPAVHIPGADWASGWKDNPGLCRKFTTFCLEDSPAGGADGDVREELRPGESILEMLQRVQREAAAASRFDDHLRRFETFNRLFRRGIAPRVADGVFRGQGRGRDAGFDAPEKVDWYGAEEPCRGFKYYHGATLNLHCGFGDTWGPEIARKLHESSVFPSALADLLHGDERGPNVLDAVWATIGRYIFPWAGKSFEKISGRKLSMLLDESDDLAERYPERVSELKSHPASWPHYALVKKNREHHWAEPGAYAAHLQAGPWDRGMPESDKEFWRAEAASNWVFGLNLQDSRILAADAVFRALDMNYRAPLASIQKLADSGPSPFVRQGYMFLGVSGRDSILPMNGGRKVFQFHYRFPMIGGAAPIGLCLDELVEIAEGLFLGQLIYSTALFTPFHSSVDPAAFQYQLFGYFLLLDDDWERHRRAIGLDVNT